MGRIHRITKVTAVKVEGDQPYVLLFATGRVVGAGWTLPRLTGRIYTEPPADGIFDLDFEADPPPQWVTSDQTPVAVAAALPQAPPWVTGVRVHARSNSITTSFALKTDPDLQVPTTLTPLRVGEGGPWPGVY